MKKVPTSRKGFVVPFKNDDQSLNIQVVEKTSVKKEDKTISTNPLEKKPPKVPKTTTKTTSTTTTTTSKPINITSKSVDIKSNFYKVRQCPLTSKKHKLYQDGYVCLNHSKNYIEMFDENGKEIGKSVVLKISDFKEGFKCTISSREVIVDDSISQEEFQSSMNMSSTVDDTPEPVIVKTEIKQFKSHSTSSAPITVSGKLKPRSDPNAPDALVLYRPESESETYVVVDSFLSKKLRPHQKIGVQFIWDCITGRSNEFGNGVILADQMGLGKTLQTLTLLWTAIKQSKSGSPLVKKVIIVTPTNLVGNWKKEIVTWLGSERLKPFVLTDSASKKTKEMMEDFKTSLVYPVLIITYEQCRIYSNILETLNNIGLLICDEAHRLKNSNSQTTLSINNIKASKRILITGTPIQNDLGEFYAMVDFCNPGSLGSPISFKKSFINPIMKFRETGQGNDGLEKSKELAEITKSFIIRRKSNLLEQYLPPKSTHIVFCGLTTVQSEVYLNFTKSKSIETLISKSSFMEFQSDEAQEEGTGDENLTTLSAITILKKLCNSPLLIENSVSYKNVMSNSERPNLVESSTKFQFIRHLISVIKPLNDKIVLVSNYTQTLDLMEQFLKELGVEFYRLDGSVNAEKRQLLVDRFNESTNKFNVFLLSSKAGGVGINLIGGNHIVLFDPDWNPAIDQQAMARVWREGQTKPVQIYRLISTGTIEEKIYQRQLMKESISNSIVDKVHNEKKSFSQEELRDLFSYNSFTKCETHDLLQCQCNALSSNSTTKRTSNTSNNNSLDLLKQIDHLDSWDHNLIGDMKKNVIFTKELNSIVSYIFTAKQKPSTKFNNGNESISFLESDQAVQTTIEDDADDDEKPKKKQSTKKATTSKNATKKHTKQIVEDEPEEDQEEEEEDKIQKKKRKVIIEEDDLLDLEFK
ncbi:SNF2-related domain-containing protein [Tieghemostelium lacteum]|uniref:SNF2-related domain-containing protein n=1 Tax=Tieghemostelium lacteum TaxID=361077 RepID=A0A151ZEN1_TIELA|nr:SNF2-related domain-containing protein [Tieghemostelium lacteum]|eukprot:KYQ92395.1 SNF2-related domain-containing protein [Tieghemostelium lacteum]